MWGSGKAGREKEVWAWKKVEGKKCRPGAAKGACLILHKRSRGGTFGERLGGSGG